MKTLTGNWRDRYNVPWSGFPGLHYELEWYATDDDKVIGVVILDGVDHDHSWVALTKDERGVYRGEDLAASVRGQALATKQLHAAMMRIAAE